MNPPDHISSEQVSFLVQFYPRLYSLPGWDEPNSDLRRLSADILWDYPDSLINPMECVHKFQEENRDKPQLYKGDLEADFLKFLGQVQKAAKENPVDVEFDFP